MRLYCLWGTRHWEGYPDPLPFQAREQEDAQWTVEETEAWGGFFDGESM